MANLDFFAVRSDLEEVVGFVFAETDFRVFDSYSAFGQELREYCSFAELTVVQDVGVDRHGHGTAVLLQLWSPTVMPKPEIERITLDPRRCNGFTFRYRIGGFGLAQLYLGGIHERIITKSHSGHFSERGAREHGDVGGVDWGVFQKVSGRLQRHIGRKLAVAKAPGRPILPGAFEKFKEGYELKESARHRLVYSAIALRSTVTRL